MRALLEETREIQHSDDHQLLSNIKKERREPDIKTPLAQTNCSDLDAVLRNANLPHKLRIAGFVFLRHLKDRPWLQKLDDGLLASRVALALAFADFGYSLALCGHGNWPCRDKWECPQCCKHFKADPVIAEYKPVYKRADHHYALAFGFTTDPSRAGVWFVSEKDNYVKPNAHAYCNCKRELTVNDGLLFLRHLADSYRKLPGGGRLYSIVHLEELTSAKQVRAWIHYILKPHKFIEPTCVRWRPALIWRPSMISCAGASSTPVPGF